MFSTTLKAATTAALLAIGTLGVTPVQAGDLTITFSLGAEPVHYKGRGYGGREGHYRPRRKRACHPGRALRKARALGVRRARIFMVGPRGTVIHGRRWGRPVKVGIGRVRGCPVVYANRRYH